VAKKAKISFVCSSCGQDYTKWHGRCTNCGEWETITEFRESVRARSSARSVSTTAPAEAVLLSSCDPETVPRRASGFAQIDRVLGGGLVPGAAILLGGDPGIGKSTVLLQMASSLGGTDSPVLYVSAEESLEQISLRAGRIACDTERLHVLAETRANHILTAMEKLTPRVVIIDSIQTVFSEDLESAPGSVSQVRECAALFLRYAKEKGSVVFLVGHVTKEGAIAGPRVLEHMVDTVMYFEGDTSYQYRILRAVKNRFGPAGEIALLSMSDRGLSEITDSSAFFLLNRENPQAGTAVAPVLEGSRVLVVELQALVNQTHFGLPQRVASGINPKKLALLLAVLERYGSIALGEHDVFFNVTGGLTITEPAVDLAVCAAIQSSFLNRPLKKGMAVVGELGLGGEIRPVNSMTARLKELAATGFTTCIVPKPPRRAEWARGVRDIVLLPCGSIGEVGERIF
jgi:DNA repair protein RadA/Sms